MCGVVAANVIGEFVKAPEDLALITVGVLVGVGIVPFGQFVARALR